MNINNKNVFQKNFLHKMYLNKNFFKSLFFLFLEKCICGGSPDDRITNGENAKDHEFPFHVKKTSSNFFLNF
jgi:hypothetical protein